MNRMTTARMWTANLGLGCALVAAVLSAACGGKEPPVLPQPAPVQTDTAAATPAPAPAAPAARPQPPRETLPVPPQPVMEDKVTTRTLEDLNRESPFKPVYFSYDSAELDEEAQKIAQANAGVLRTNKTWIVTVEGHCDERGTAEYNLALGERRATAVKAYLVSLGIAADRLRVVSYGKEFPFDPGHDEAAFAKNRRGHFVVTAK